MLFRQSCWKKLACCSQTRNNNNASKLDSYLMLFTCCIRSGCCEFHVPSWSDDCSRRDGCARKAYLSARYRWEPGEEEVADEQELQHFNFSSISEEAPGLILRLFPLSANRCASSISEKTWNHELLLAVLNASICSFSLHVCSAWSWTYGAESCLGIQASSHDFSAGITSTWKFVSLN